jgi:hypothetical protein
VISLRTPDSLSNILLFFLDRPSGPVDPSPPMAGELVTPLFERLADLWIHLQRLADCVRGAWYPVFLEEPEYTPDTRARAVLRGQKWVVSAGVAGNVTPHLVKGLHIDVSLPDVGCDPRSQFGGL